MRIGIIQDYPSAGLLYKKECIVDLVVTLGEIVIPTGGMPRSLLRKDLLSMHNPF